MSDKPVPVQTSAGSGCSARAARKRAAEDRAIGWRHEILDAMQAALARGATLGEVDRIAQSTAETILARDVTRKAEVVAMWMDLRRDLQKSLRERSAPNPEISGVKAAERKSMSKEASRSGQACTPESDCWPKLVETTEHEVGP